MGAGDDRPLRVFWSYSHKDEGLRDKLGEHFAVLRRTGVITDWHDRRIDAGTVWKKEIERHLLEADIVLLLVSAAFINSDYCWGDEMTTALARHRENEARVVPVILHPCGWDYTPLAELQAVPQDAKPISEWLNEHAALADVTRKVWKVAQDLRAHKSAPAPPHPDPLPPAGEGDARRDPLPPAGEGGTRRDPLPPAGEGGTRASGRARAFKDLEVFHDDDAPWCPEMVVIPAGSFLMGSPPDEKERRDAEGPQHRVTIARFAIGKHAVTFAEYDHFCEVTKREKPADEGWGRGRQPVINVSWQDAQAYVEWLSGDLGQPYRLPTESEWEYACRAGTTTPFSFGRTITPSQVNYDGNYVYGNGSKGTYREKTVAVGSLPANPWGLHEMHGNVWEWVEDIWHDDYSGAPIDGSAWTDREGINSASAWCAAAPGTTIRGSAAPPSASGSDPTSAQVARVPPGPDAFLGLESLPLYLWGPGAEPLVDYFEHVGCC